MPHHLHRQPVSDPFHPSKLLDSKIPRRAMNVLDKKGGSTTSARRLTYPLPQTHSTKTNQLSTQSTTMDLQQRLNHELHQDSSLHRRNSMAHQPHQNDLDWGRNQLVKNLHPDSTSAIIVSKVSSDEDKHKAQISPRRSVSLQRGNLPRIAEDLGDAKIRSKSFYSYSPHTSDVSHLQSSPQKEEALPTLPNLSKRPMKDEKKENEISEEKDLVNGALLGLVSLASKSRSRSASLIQSSSSHEADENTEKHLTKTPPPQPVQQLSTVTPSSSLVNVRSMNKPSRTISSSGNKRCLSCVSDGSDHTDSSAKSSQPVVSYDHNTQIQLKHPLSSRAHSQLDETKQMPQFSRKPLPLPRLDRHSMDNEPSYTLYMKRESEVPFDSYDAYMHGPRYAASNVYESRMGSLQPRMRSRPTRHFSAQSELYRGHALSEYERRTPPLPHESHPETVPMSNGDFGELKRRSELAALPHHVGRQYGPEMRGAYRDAQTPAEYQDLYIRHATSRDDVEESGYYRSADRKFPRDESYFSPNQQQYLPPRRRHHYGQAMHRPAQQMSRPHSNFYQSHYPHMNSRSYENHAQFQCPDGIVPRQTVAPQHPTHLSPQGIHPHSPYQPSIYHTKQIARPNNQELNVKKTILRRKCAWKNYPELEKFLIENREEYLKHSAKNYTIEQKQYNNCLTERLLEVAAKHNYVFDPNDFNFVAVRDRIRCYYKSYVQSNKKRGVIVGYDASGMRKKQKCEEKSENTESQTDTKQSSEPTEENVESKEEISRNDTVEPASKNFNDEKKTEE